MRGSINSSVKARCHRPSDRDFRTRQRQPRLSPVQVSGVSNPSRSFVLALGREIQQVVARPHSHTGDRGRFPHMDGAYHVSVHRVPL